MTAEEAKGRGEASGREKIIFHIDVNSAFLSWTAVKRLREDPRALDLRTVPAVVGGDQTTRHGIVTAKSLPAKKYGIRTAETVASAMQKCPGLVVVPSDFQTYREFSHAFLDILRSHTPLVEQASIDEAYMDATKLCHDIVTGAGGAAGAGLAVKTLPQGALTQRTAAVLLAGQIREEIRGKLGFTVNVGVSNNRLLAKMASDFQKPDRTHTLFPEEVPEKMWPLPIGELYGCGGRTSAHLRTLGIQTIGDAAAFSEELLISHLGDKAGRYIHRAANGIGRASVSPVREDAKSYSNEWTTSSDIRPETYESDYLPLLHSLCDKVAGRLQRDGVYGKTVTVSVKTDDFRRRSAQRRLQDPSNRTEVLYAMAVTLSEKLLFGDRGLFSEGAGVRLVGAGVTDLDDGSFRQMNLTDWLREEPSDAPAEKEPEAPGRRDLIQDRSDGRTTEQEAPNPGGRAGGEMEPPEKRGFEIAENGTSESGGRVAKEQKPADRSDRLRKMQEALNRRYGNGTVRRGFGDKNVSERTFL